MALTKEQLIAPRYKVIADYPGNRFKLGAIFTKDIGGTYVDEEHNVTIESNLSGYPHLFRKLEWHDGLKESELPEYVKVKVVGCSVPQGFVYKVCEWGVYPDEGRKWGNEGDFYALYIMEEATKTNDVGERIAINIKSLLPSDESEYNQYIQKQTP